MRVIEFHSALAAALQRFVELRRTGGCDYQAQARLLLYFDRFLMQRPATEPRLTREITEAYQETLGRLHPREDTLSVSGNSASTSRGATAMLHPGTPRESVRRRPPAAHLWRARCRGCWRRTVANRFVPNLRTWGFIAGIASASVRLEIHARKKLYVPRGSSRRAGCPGGGGGAMPPFGGSWANAAFPTTGTAAREFTICGTRLPFIACWRGTATGRTSTRGSRGCPRTWGMWTSSERRSISTRRRSCWSKSINGSTATTCSTSNRREVPHDHSLGQPR